MAFSEYSYAAAELDARANPPQPNERASRDPFSAPTSSLGEADYRPGYGGKPPDREVNVDPARFTYPWGTT